MQSNTNTRTVGRYFQIPVLIAFLGLALTTNARAQHGTFATFDYPGALNT